MEPARFRIRRSQQLITGRAGLVLAGQALARFAQLPQQLAPRFPVRGTALPTSDVVKSYIGLLTQAKSDFEAIEAHRGDGFFTQALGLSAVPSPSRLRQRLDALASAEALEAVDGASERLLARAKAPITAAATEHVPLDIVFVMDNAETAKEGVSRTYAGVDGYAPIGAYLGEEGWCVGRTARGQARGGARGHPQAPVHRAARARSPGSSCLSPSTAAAPAASTGPVVACSSASAPAPDTASRCPATAFCTPNDCCGPVVALVVTEQHGTRGSI